VGVQQRGSAPVAVVLLVGLAVLLAAGVGAALTQSTLPAEPRYTSVEGVASADGTIQVTHAGGAPVDVRRLDVTVTVDGTPLRYQPPVPFFSARGFYSGPRGPFNSAADPAWTTGEPAAFRVAGTNDPGVTPGSEVVVRLAIEERPVATLRLRVGGG
jgi:hypothetical protein